MSEIPPGVLPDFGQVFVIAKKEFMDNVRSRWILVLSLVFIVLALVVSALGGVSEGSGIALRGFSATAIGMMTLSTSLVPILGLMVSYATIAGERENGSLPLLLSLPVTRLEVLLGKFLGLGAVLALSILAGLGSSGVAIAASAGADGWQGYAGLMVGTLLLALAFVSLGILFSTLASKRSSAIALAVFVWFFFTVVWGLLIFGLAAASGTSFDITNPSAFSIPQWVLSVDAANPAEELSALTLASFGMHQVMGFPVEYPAWVTAGSMLAALALWALAPLALAFLRLRRLDF